MDEYWLVADGRVAPWDGDLDDYARWLLDRDAAPTTVTGEAEEASAPVRTRADRQAEKREAAELRKRLKPLKDEIGRLERELEAAQGRLAALETTLADEALYTDARRDDLTALLKEQGELRGRVETLEDDWLHASARYEAQLQGDDVL
jgi:ATP-binding cassette subfamily F protein 3